LVLARLIRIGVTAEISKIKFITYLKISAKALTKNMKKKYEQNQVEMEDLI